MPRATNRPAARAKRKATMKLAKGYFGRRKKVWTVAKNAVEKGLSYAYEHRRLKKREFRTLWIARINSAARSLGTSYSVLMNGLTKNNILLDRKVLSELAINDTSTFEKIVNKVVN